MGEGCVAYWMYHDCVLTHGSWCVSSHDRYCGERAIDGCVMCRVWDTS